MAEKFYLSGTEHEAELYFKSVIDSSLKAILERIYDEVHIIITKFK